MKGLLAEKVHYKWKRFLTEADDLDAALRDIEEEGDREEEEDDREEEEDEREEKEDARQEADEDAAEEAEADDEQDELEAKLETEPEEIAEIMRRFRRWKGDKS